MSLTGKWQLGFESHLFDFEVLDHFMQPLADSWRDFRGERLRSESLILEIRHLRP